MLRLTPATLLLLFLGVATAEGRQADPGAKLKLPPFNYNFMFAIWPEDLRPPDAESASQRTARLRELVARGDDSVETGLALADALRSGGEKAAADSLRDALCARLADAELHAPGNLGVELDYGRALYARGWEEMAAPRLVHVLRSNHSEWRAALPLSEMLLKVVNASRQNMSPAGMRTTLSATLPEEGFEDWLEASALAAPPIDAATLWCYIGTIRLGIPSRRYADPKALCNAVADCYVRASVLAPQCTKLKAGEALYRLLPYLLFGSSGQSAGDSGNNSATGFFVRLPPEDQKRVAAIESELTRASRGAIPCAEIQFAFALIDLLRGDMDRALERAPGAATAGANGLQLLELLFVASFLERRWDACEKVGELLVATADTAPTHCLLAKLAGERGDLARAEVEYQIAAARKPDCDDAWLGLALVARAAGRELAVIQDRLAHVGSAGRQGVSSEFQKTGRALLQALETGATDPADRKATADQLLQCGKLYCTLGQHDLAIARLRAAVDAADAAHDDARCVEALDGLAYSCDALCLWSQAHAAAERSVELHSRPGAVGEVDALLRLVIICAHLERPEEQLRLLERTLSLAHGEDPERAHAVAITVAAMYFDLDQFDRCEAICRDRLADEASPLGGGAASSARCLLALCEGMRASPAEAESCFTRALAEAEGAREEQLICKVLGKMTIAALERGDARRTAVLMERLGSLSDQAVGRAMLLLVRAMREVYSADPGVALASLEETEAAISSTPDRTLGEAARIDLRRQWSALPQLASSLACRDLRKDRAVDPGRAFALVESTMARTLLEGLQERMAGMRSDLDAKAASERQDLLGRLEQLRRAANRETEPSPATKTAIERTQSALDELEARARATSGRLAQLRAPTHVELAQLQQKLAPDEAVVMFVTGNPASYGWAIRRDGVDVRLLPRHDQLAADATELARALAKSDAPARAFVAPARRLFDELFGRLLPRLEGAHRVHVVPDGALAFVPFDALLTADPPAADTPMSQLPFLLRDSVVSCTPSCSALVASSSDPRATNAARKDALLLADALYGREEASHAPSAEPLDSRARGAFDPDRLARLRATRDEARAIAESLLGADEGAAFVALRDLPRSGAVHARRFDLLVGADANEDVLQQDLRAYRVVHLAVHGYFDSEYPQFSGIVLSPGTGESRSGFVNLLELGLLQLDADVVFLSACESARGGFEFSEGPKSAVRSLLLSGARSVIGTNWEVHDEAAVALATAFYDGLFHGKSAEEALREAKRAALDRKLVVRGAAPIEPGAAPPDDGLAHPHYWAPYVLWGGALGEKR